MIAEMPVNIGLEGTYTLKYSVDSYSIGDTKVADGFEAAGFYNSGNNVRPIQDLKMRVHLNVAINEYLNALMYVNYTSEYDDRRDAVKSAFGVDSVDDHTTIDFHLSTTLMDDSLSLTASVLNATDEDPPVAYGDLMYDAYSHNPLGRMLKVGFKYSM
jgi:iron complex outermembrane receptor protein